MITIFNPTNEILKMVYAGIDMVLLPGDKRPVDDACANHLLNAMGPRGLCQLIYGDDEETVGKQGRARNIDFKKAQVGRYNVMNEQRKMQGMGYLKPGREVEKYALELGIELLQPYHMKDAEKGEMSRIIEENQTLKAQLDKLTKLVTSLAESRSDPGVKMPDAHIGPTSGEPRGPGRPRREV